MKRIAIIGSVILIIAVLLIWNPIGNKLKEKTINAANEKETKLVEAYQEYPTESNFLALIFGSTALFLLVISIFSVCGAVIWTVIR